MKARLLSFDAFVFAIVFSFFATQANAKDLPFTVTNLKQAHEVNLKTADEAYFTISSVEVNEVQDADEFVIDTLPSNNKAVDLGAIIMTVDKLIALGKKIYAIVEAGKPVVNANLSNKVSVLPNVDKPNAAMYAMSNWQAPKTRVYNVAFKNLFGMKVVSFNYAVTFEWGGKHKGKGAYIHAARIAADQVDVAWGFNFEASTEAVSIVNRGSEENPVAAVTFKLNYTAKSMLKEIQSEESFYITGDGDVRKVY